MLNIVLLGPPGAGKGTQSKKLVSKHRFLHVSPGEIFRFHIEKQTSWGRDAGTYINKGELVPDQMVINLVSDFLDKHFKAGMGVILDGYPRRIKQAIALDKQLHKHTGRGLDCALFLDIPQEEILTRIEKRCYVEGRLDDSNRSMIQKRITTYHTETSPIFEHYDEHTAGAHRISGKGSIEEVFERLSKQITFYKSQVVEKTHTRG